MQQPYDDNELTRLGVEIALGEMGSAPEWVQGHPETRQAFTEAVGAYATHLFLFGDRAMAGGASRVYWPWDNWDVIPHIMAVGDHVAEKLAHRLEND